METKVVPQVVCKLNMKRKNKLLLLKVLEDEPAVDFGVGPSVGNIGNRITSMSPFERLMVNKMDNLCFHSE